eukprot:TRINITY_DN22587_c0_g1_i1.p1 TRINITY_DN22587_c0_g1~~TRINITY_DN22587_c0_g1_i1.p1  ORF type:complete len:906 (+),score=139.02 TRINITY_DN22587_c0_g1_i1:27-2720(+)
MTPIATDGLALEDGSLRLSTAQEPLTSNMEPAAPADSKSSDTDTSVPVSCACSSDTLYTGATNSWRTRIAADERHRLPPVGSDGLPHLVGWRRLRKGLLVKGLLALSGSTLFWCLVGVFFLKMQLRHTEEDWWDNLLDVAMDAFLGFVLITCELIAVICFFVLAARVVEGCQRRPSEISIAWCLLAAPLLVLTSSLAWFLLLRHCIAEKTRIICVNFWRRGCKPPAQVSFTPYQVFSSWQFLPLGVFEVALSTATSPLWVLFFGIPRAIVFVILGIPSGGVEWSVWRNVIVGIVFWLTVLFGWALMREWDFGESFLWRSLCRVVFITILSVPVYMAWFFTSPPFVNFWAFTMEPFALLADFILGKNVRLGPPEFIEIFLFSWAFVRMVFIVRRMWMARWYAHERVELAFRHAFSLPFVASLDQSFCDAPVNGPAGFLDTGSAVRNVIETMVARRSRDSVGSSRGRSGSTANPSSSERRSRSSSSTSEQRRRRTSSVSSSGRAAALRAKQRKVIAAVRKNLVVQSSDGVVVPERLFLRVRRDHIIEDSGREIWDAPANQLLAPNMHVSFVGEPGMDHGGVSKDWFDAVAAAVSTDGAGGLEGTSLFMQAADRSLLPRPVSCDDEVARESRYRFLFAVGKFLALSVIREQPLPLALNPVVCKYLLEVPVGMDDVSSLDPDFYRHRVKRLLETGYIPELEVALGEPLTFMSAPTDSNTEPVPLCPFGETRIVTEENKMEYLRLLCEAHLCGGIRRELACLLGGFWEVIPLRILRECSVRPRELVMMISGNAELCPLEWKASAETGDSQVHKWFWEVVSELESEQRSSLLHFSTGSRRLPLGGFQELDPRFSVEVTSLRSIEHLPVAHTCANKIVLQQYRTKEMLRDKLVAAISAEGFGFA